MRRSAFPLLLIAITAMISLIQSRGVLGENTAAAAGAPAFTLTNHDGQAVSLADFAGKIVVLEWFNERCPVTADHHRKDKNTMVDLANKYKDQGVVWLAVNSTGAATNESNAAAAKRFGVDYPILNDSEGVTGKAYSAQATPHMFVISKAGTIAYRGAIDDRGSINYVDQAVSELLADKPVSVPQTKPYGCGIKYKR